MKDHNEEEIARNVARQMAELNRKNAEANKKLLQRSEAEKKAQEEEEAKRTRALEQEVLDRKLSEENERRRKFFEEMKSEYEAEKKPEKKSRLKKKDKKKSSFSLFGKKEAPKKEKAKEQELEEFSPSKRQGTPKALRDPLLKHKNGLWIEKEETTLKVTFPEEQPKEPKPASEQEAKTEPAPEPVSEPVSEETPAAEEAFAPEEPKQAESPEKTDHQTEVESLFSSIQEQLNLTPEESSAPQEKAEPEPAPEPAPEPVPAPEEKPAPAPVPEPKPEPKPEPEVKPAHEPAEPPVPEKKDRKKPLFSSLFGKRETPKPAHSKEKDYPTKKLSHDNPEDKELSELKEKLYPGRYEPSSDGRVEVAANDPEQGYLDWKEQAKRSRERLNADRFRTMLHDVQEHEDDIVVMALITADMDKLVLLRSLDEFFQFVEKQDYNVVLAYAFVIYKHQDPKYYLEIPDDEHIQKLMGSIYDLFMKNTVVTPNMLGQVPNIGIFDEIYINKAGK